MKGKGGGGFGVDQVSHSLYSSRFLTVIDVFWHLSFGRYFGVFRKKKFQVNFVLCPPYSTIVTEKLS